MKKKVEKILLRCFSLPVLSFIGFVYGYYRGGSKSFSQFGEDLIVLNFFERLGIKTGGYYLDIGAYHPTFISNTHLLHKRGWSGTCIDLCEEKLRYFRLKRRGRVQVICAAVTGRVGQSVSVSVFKHAKILSEIDTLDRNVAMKNKKARGYDFVEGKIQQININELLSLIGVDVDLLNIDVEGLDGELISAIDFSKFKPKCIIFECNEVFGGDEKTKSCLKDNGYSHLFTSGGSTGYYLSSLN